MDSYEKPPARMRLDHFDLNLLVALDALLETGSVTRASERLHIGVSATSSALGRCREHFNDELLQQVGRRMELTPLAQQLVEPVRDVLLRTRATLQARASFEPDTEERTFVLNASDYATTVLLTRLVRHLQGYAPRVRLEFLNMGERVHEHLDRGSVDFAIFPERNTSQEHPSEALYEDSYSFVVWRGNSRVGEAVSLEEYLAMDHIRVRFGAGQPHSFEELALQEAGVERRFAATVGSFHAQAQLVVGTPWGATLQTRMAHWCAGFLPIRVLPLPVEIPALRMVMQWHRFQNKAPAHAWMREQLRVVAATLKAKSD